MKSREWATSGGASAPTRQTKKPQTGEWDGQVVNMGDDFVELEETTERAIDAMKIGAGAEPSPDVPGVGVRRAAGPGERAGQGEAQPRGQEQPADQARHRRTTVVSPIPALLAESMGQVRDPAAPLTPHHDVTRRVVDPVERRPVGDSGTGYQVELIDDVISPSQARVVALIARAQACMNASDLGGAVLAADEAMAEAAKASPSGMSPTMGPARPLFDKIFASYVGMLGQVPVKARSDEDLEVYFLDEESRALLRRVDGILTLEQLVEAAKIAAVDAVRIATSLLQAGIIRLV